MDELDRHRQTVQKMTNKIIDLHAKVYTSHHTSEHILAYYAGIR